MLRTHYSTEVPKKDGEKVKVAGWIKNIRDIGKLKFLILRDKNGEIQITIKDTKIIEQVKSFTKESIVSVNGTVSVNKQAPDGREVIPERIELINKAEIPLPLDLGIASKLDTRLNWRCLDLRKPENLAIFKIQSKLIEGLLNYFQKKDFIFTFTPTLMGSPSESGADLFPVIFFNKEAYLRQDPMLHRQLMIISGFDKVFEIGPSWRAELSHTTRHLCEHRTCVAEISFITDETDIIKLEEDVIIHVLKTIKKGCSNELKILDKEIKIPEKPFPELRFPKLYEILEKFDKKIEFGEDYDWESEGLLWNYVKKKYKTDFFFVNRFPFKAKPFYVMRVDDEPTWARSVDLIFKGAELSSGGQREHRYKNLIQNIKEKKMGLENLEWYTKFFKYGVPPHGGFSIGIERMTKQLLDLKNIREATLFSRDPERLIP